MPVFTLGFVPFSDLTATSGDPLTTTSATGATGSFTVNPDAAPTQIFVDDDDTVFEDAFQETGGPQTLTDPVTVNGTTFSAGSVVELEFSVSATDEFGVVSELFYVRIGGVNVGITAAEPTPTGTAFTLGASNAGDATPYATLPCFTAGTLIDTETGSTPIEDLAVGDLVRTMDHGLQPIRWIGQRRLEISELMANPALRPVEIAAGVLDNSRPLVVSPQHRMCLSGWQAELLYGEPVVLVPAKALLSDDRVCVVPATRAVTYIHLLFDTHEVIFAEGAASESFHPGEMGVAGFSDAQRDELQAIFGNITEAAEDRHTTAYPILKVHEATAFHA